MTCIRCDGIGFIRRVIDLPESIYGKPQQATVSRPCPYCSKGKIEAEPYFDGKAAAAGD